MSVISEKTENDAKKIMFDDDNEESGIDKDEVIKKLTEHKTDTRSDIITDKDIEQYTKVDHLDEDPLMELNMKGRGKFKQVYALFSFISPEGVMNCNIRALKMRGCFETREEAEEKVKELEKIDPYFKIFIGEVGKWLEFDPPVSKVEKEMSSDPKYQKILDSQAKIRMNKINAMVGKYKENTDNKEAGISERIKETKMSGASHTKLAKSINTTSEQEIKTEQPVKPKPERTVRANETTADRLRRRLAEKQAKSQEKQELDSLAKNDREEKNDLDKKYETVTNAQKDLISKREQMKEVDANIEKIKKLMATKKATK